MMEKFILVMSLQKMVKIVLQLDILIKLILVLINVQKDIFILRVQKCALNVMILAFLVMLTTDVVMIVIPL